MFRGGGFWRGFFRLTGRGIRAGGRAIPGKGIVDIASVVWWIIAFTTLIWIFGLNPGGPWTLWLFLLYIGIAALVAAWVNATLRKGLAEWSETNRRYRGRK